jgi:hypothetical protein
MDGDYNSDDDSPAPEFETTREGIIFCIDASDKMLGGVDDDDLCYLQRCFKVCIHCCVLFVQQLLTLLLFSVCSRQNAGQHHGIGQRVRGHRITGGAGPSSTTTDVTILFDVSRPGADILKKLDSYIKCAGSYRNVLLTCTETLYTYENRLMCNSVTHHNYNGTFCVYNNNVK